MRVLRRNNPGYLAQINIDPGVSLCDENQRRCDMSLITVFVMVAALCAAISLFNGVVSMAHGGAEDQGGSHWLMFQRVGWQALALLFILFALFSSAA
jgi:hypothetical protein